MRSLRGKIVATMMLLILLVLIIAVIGVNAISSLDRSVGRELETVLRGSELGTGLVGAVTAEIRAAEQYLVRPDQLLIDEFINNGDSAYDFQHQYRELPSLTTNDRVALNHIAALQAQVEVDYAQAHALTDIGQGASADQAVGRARAPSDTLIHAVNSLSRAQGDRARTRAAELTAQAGRRRAALWVLFAAVMVIGVGASIVTVRTVDHPLRRLVDAADRFGSGDLRPIELGEMPTELGRLGLAMEHMGARLRDVVGSVTTESNQISASASDFSAMSQEIAASSGEISTAMLRVASSAEQQRTGMDQAAALLRELRESSSSITESASRNMEMGAHIRTLAADHRGDVEHAGRTLLEIREVVRTSATQVQELARQSEAITDFIDLIKQISSQTNLLALNAAIEAARAGEHGRGFAVVAEEVRRLADSSADAAEEVTKTVEFIRRQIREVSDTMAIGSSSVTGVESVAHAAASALDEIARVVDDVHGAASAVSDAASQQRTLVDQLAERTQQVSQSANEHAAASEEVTAAAEEQSASTEEMASSAGDLLHGAQRLTEAIRDFKI